MKAVEVKPGVYWVGAVDWDIRSFHGYKTQRGTSYNAYLLIDDKVTLVDTVKAPFFEEMLARVRDVIAPERIEVIVSNHVEMDHSGSLPRMLEVAPNATVVTTKQGEAGLRAHFKADWRFRVVEPGAQMPIGRRSLHFVPCPMVHWPDSMVTYVPEDKLLLSNDGFGQHIASAVRFADEFGFEIAMEEAAKYYANIVLPFGAQVQKLLAALGGAQVDMLATSHGLIWRERLGDVIGAYKRWAANETGPRAVIIYDTMWGSTEKLAYALREGLEAEGVPAEMGNLSTTHISDIMTHVLEARGILIGSPTLNARMFPSVAAAVTYIAGLRPLNRLGLAFGSYGWGKQGVRDAADAMKQLGWAMPVEEVGVQWVPGADDLARARDAGARFARAVKGEQIAS